MDLYLKQIMFRGEYKLYWGFAIFTKWIQPTWPILANVEVSDIHYLADLDADKADKNWLCVLSFQQKHVSK